VPIGSESALILAAAVAPPVVIALVVLRLGGGRAVGFADVGAFLWGALVAPVAATLMNDALGAWATRVLGDATAGWAVPTIVAPLVEECVKGVGVALVLALAPGPTAGVPAGILTGALVGLGFAATENVTYYTLAAVQAGYAGLGRAVYLRGVVQGLNHAAFTAATGAGIAWGRRRGRTIALGLGGLAVAVVAHAVWNGVTSRVITDALCNAPTPGGACARAPASTDLFVTAPLLVVASIGPLALGLGLFARRARRA
jgi:RsiW-degrading membrane proteinase PrsW (M82 family)